MKKQKMYVPVVIDTIKGKKVTLVSANKIKELEEVMPSQEALDKHITIQKIKLQKDKNYKPEPLYISIESDIFKEIIYKIRYKCKEFNEKQIPLVFQYPAIPICIIVSKE